MLHTLLETCVALDSCAIHAMVSSAAPSPATAPTREDDVTLAMSVGAYRWKGLGGVAQA